MDQKITQDPAAATDPAGGGATEQHEPGDSSEVGSGAPDLRDAENLPLVGEDGRRGLGGESLTANPKARDPESPGQPVEVGPSS